MNLTIQPQQNNFKPKFGMKMDVDFETLRALQELTPVKILKLHKKGGAKIEFAPAIKKLKAKTGERIHLIVHKGKQDGLQVKGSMLRKAKGVTDYLITTDTFNVSRKASGGISLKAPNKAEVPEHGCFSFGDVINFIKSNLDKQLPDKTPGFWAQGPFGNL